MTHRPADLFFDWLTGRPDAVRTAIAVDGDRLLAVGDMLEKDKLVDKVGREWRLVTFRGDDISFRKTYRAAWKAKQKVLIVITRDSDSEKRIDVSTISDILASNEAGAPFDISVPAVLRRICPQINFPVFELMRYKDVLLERLDEVPAAAKKIIEKWGRPDDWGRGQVAAFALMLRNPDWVLSKIWPDDFEPGPAIAHSLRILSSIPAGSPDIPIMRMMLAEAVRPAVKPYLFWLDQPIDQLSTFLLIRKFAADTKLQNPLVQLQGTQIFPVEFPLETLEALSESVIANLHSDPKAWRQVEHRAEEFLTTSRASRLASLVSGDLKGTAVSALSSAALLLPYVEKRLQESLSEKSVKNLDWILDVESSAAVASDEIQKTERQKQCSALVRLATRIRSMEHRLAASIPRFQHVDSLLEWYVNSGHYLLELDAAHASHDQEEIQHESLSHIVLSYLSGGDEDAAAEGSLAHRVGQRLDDLDTVLAKLIVASPDEYLKSPRSFVNFIKDELGDEVQKILSGESEKRVWVLIFDGMRYDTWESVVQPLLGERFMISSEARFCTLPSYTLYARRSVLAGRAPSEWLTGKRAESHAETTLFAENVGLSKADAKEKVRLLTDADTNKAREKSNFKETSLKPFNVLIYPISDECHEFRGDLAQFNDKIRREILGNEDLGVRGILGDLLKRVKTDDIILSTSDHGFIELSPSQGIIVQENDAAKNHVAINDAVKYRYSKGFKPLSLTTFVDVEVGSEPHCLCVGRTWLKREGVGQSTRYSHGGVSLAELAVPVARLIPATEKRISVRFQGLPDSISVDEDSVVDTTFQIKNDGTSEAKFEVIARDNLDREILRSSGKLSPAKVQPMTLRISGDYRSQADGGVDIKRTVTAVTIRLRYVDESDLWRDAVDGISNIQIKVHPKKTKLVTDALSGFDEV